MEDNNLKPENPPTEENKPEIFVNEYGGTKDSAVVVEESDRTVLLTENETIIIPKETVIDVPPKNRERKIYAGMWGKTEAITVGLALLSILTTVLVFVFLVLPAQREYENNRAERDDLEKKLLTARSRYGNITTTQERVAELVKSANDLESRLPNATNGRTALYQKINGLIAAYGLINTSGPDYAPLEIIDQSRNNQQLEQESGRAKFMSIFPGDYVTVTVDGSYQNLRRFIREIETGDQFIVVSAVELEPSENKEKQENNQTNPTQASTNFKSANPSLNNPTQIQVQDGIPKSQTQPAKIDRGKTRGETVTLRLEMAVYFRRPNFAPMETSVTK